MKISELKPDHSGEGTITLMDGDKQVGELSLRIEDREMKIFHTEVSQGYEGQGLAKKLLQAAVDYARERDLRIDPLCPYVHAQFKKGREEYADVWLKRSV